MKKVKYIYERVGHLTYRREVGSDKRQLKYKHPDYGPPYWRNNPSNQIEWFDEDVAKTRYWYNEYIGRK